MSSRKRSIAAAAVLALFTLSQPAIAQKPDAPTKAQTDAATAHFKRGVELFEEQDYTGALIEFRRAYDTAPNYRVLYNIGNTCFQLTDYACALRSLEKYLADGGSEIQASRRADVERDLGKLRQRVAKVDIKTNVPGADISIDDAPVGKAPLPEPVLVSAGRRKITATFERRTPVTKTVDVAGGDSLPVQLDFAAEEPAPTASPAPTQTRTDSAPPPAPERNRTLPIILWTGAGVAAVGATVTGIIALKASSDLKTKRETVDASPSDLTSTSSRAKTFALVTDIVGVAAIGLTGAAIYFTFIKSPSAQPTTSVGFTGTGVVVNHTF
jgi:hypothetical protein